MTPLSDRQSDAFDRSVKEAVASGLATLIADHQSAVDSFGDDTRPETNLRAQARS